MSFYFFRIPKRVLGREEVLDNTERQDRARIDWIGSNQFPRGRLPLFYFVGTNLYIAYFRALPNWLDQSE